MNKFKKLVIVPCRTDVNTSQAVIDDNSRPPYGYHHVICIFSDDSEYLVATIDCSFGVEQVKGIVSVINTDDVPVEVDPLYYQ